MASTVEEVSQRAEQLEGELIISIQEMQVKLGSFDGVFSMYLPNEAVSSVDPENVLGAVLAPGSILEGLIVENLQDRVRITAPASVCSRVRELPVDPVITAMVDSVKRRDGLEAFVTAVESVNPNVTVKPVEGDGFDHILFMTDDSNPFVYCIDTDHGHVSYHRFTRREYLRFGFPGLE